MSETIEIVEQIELGAPDSIVIAHDKVAGTVTVHVNGQLYFRARRVRPGVVRMETEHVVQA